MCLLGLKGVRSSSWTSLRIAASKIGCLPSYSYFFFPRPPSPACQQALWSRRFLVVKRRRGAGAGVGAGNHGYMQHQMNARWDKWADLAANSFKKGKAGARALLHALRAQACPCLGVGEADRPLISTRKANNTPNQPADSAGRSTTDPSYLYVQGQRRSPARPYLPQSHSWPSGRDARTAI